MKENVYDEVLDKVYKRVDNVSDTLSKRFGNMRGFNEKPIPTKDLFSAYVNLSEEDMVYLASRHDRESVSQFIADMESYRRRFVNART